MRKGLLNGFSLKLIMTALMLLDHIYYFLPNQPVWMGMAGRLVAPVFAFLVAEGLCHTRDRDKYIRRMLYFGIVMLFGNIILQLIYGDSIGNSIFISLAISAKLTDAIEKYRKGSPYYNKSAYILLLLLLSMLFEGMWLCPAMVATFYFLRSRTFALCAVYAGIITPLAYFTGLGAYYQWLMVFALIPILLYNGERGPGGTAAKYFFYLFYPLHIWALYLMGHYLI